MTQEDYIEEVMQRVRKLELKARRLVRESFSGEYHSSFKGQGLDFDDFREYQHGDEIRFIDWNVTARMNQPFIRKFREERELTVLLAVDISGSTGYGSVQFSKRELAAEAAAIVGFSALHNNDKVGLILFAGDVEKVVAPAKGTRHLLRLIREILSTKPKSKGSSFEPACRALLQSEHRRGLVFMISDFMAPDMDQPLGTLARKHDTVALRVTDPSEMKLPDVGRVVMLDPETGDELLVSTGNTELRRRFEALQLQRAEETKRILRKHGVDNTDLSTAGDPLQPLHQLFRRRSRRRTA